MKTSRKSALLATACSIVLAASGVATAQPVDDESPRELETVIVTGEKFDRSLQDTPTSVKVITAEDIETEAIIDVFDIIERTANMASVFGESSFSIRGINNSSVSGAGIGDLATVYLDGAPLSRDAIGGAGPLDVWDLTQVEILRGPQSTIQGRNALAGAIIMKTADPSYDWGGRVRFMGTDQNGERRLGVAFGGGIIEDQVAFRIAAETSEEEGLVFNPTLNDEVGGSEGDMLRAKLLIEPDAVPNLSVLLSYMSDDRQKGVRYHSYEGGSTWSNRVDYSDYPSFERTDSEVATANISYDLSSALNLTSVTTYNKTDRYNQYDGDYTAQNISYSSYATESETFSEELRLSFDTGKFQGVLGAYYSEYNLYDYDYESAFSLNLDEDLGLTDLLVSFGFPLETAQFITSLYPERIFIETFQDFPQEISTKALFGDATWQVTDRLKLHGGFRYDQEDQTIGFTNDVSLVDPLPNPEDYLIYGVDVALVVHLVNDYIQAEVDNASSSAPPADTDFEAFLPKVGVSYDLAQDKTLSFIVQRGYRSGGSSVNPAQATVVPYDQEFTWNYELAFRSLWLDGDLTVNANAFYIDWTDQQVQVNLSNNVYDYEIQNAGSSRVFGFELESFYRLTESMEINASVGHADTKFDDFIAENTEVSDLSGNEFASAPRWTLGAGATWRNPHGFFANVNANYASASYSSVTTQDERNVPERTLVNAKIGWENERIGAFLTATNIFDEEYYDYAFEDPDAGAYAALLGDPRIIGVVLEGRF